MVTYPLSHLTQSDDQPAMGPIQDDEGLFLFALIRVMRLNRVLEIGGLGGYSARNFAAAIDPSGKVYSVDIHPVTQVAPNHITIQRDVNFITADDVDAIPVDLVFFDCHAYEPQMTMFKRLRAAGMITERTVLALHDTNLHPRKLASWPYEIAPGHWVHAKVERRMVNDFKAMG